MTPAESTPRRAQTSDAAPADGPRGLAVFARYVVLGLVTLSVLPAAAAQPYARAQGRSQLPGDALAASAGLDPARLTRAAFVHASPAEHAALARASRAEEPAASRNMTASAGGKRLALKLEMTREQAGNLLLEQVAPN